MVVSITTGIFTTYGAVLNWGGPLGIWTWPIVIVGQLLVALIFAALASRIPLAGYSYQWMSRLANPKIGWLIGWVSFIFLIVDVVAVVYIVVAISFADLFSFNEYKPNVSLFFILIINLLPIHFYFF